MKPSILITSNAYFPNIGGVENSLRYLAKAYLAIGYDVDVVVSDINTVDDTPLAKDETLDGIRIHRYASYCQLPILLRPLRAVLMLLAMFCLLRKIKLQRKPVMTLSRFHTNTLVAWGAGLSPLVYLLPGVVRYQNQPGNLSQRHGFHRLKQLISCFVHDLIQQAALRCADSLAVFSDNMKEQVLSCFDAKKELLVLKPGVDHNRFIPMDEFQRTALLAKYGLPTDKSILLSIGRCVRAKGFIYALNAMTELQDCHLVLVGDGEEFSTYQQFVIERKLQSQVTLIGSVQDPTQFYQLADMFLMTSTYEPLGQTILEALSSGLPIVSFRPSDSVVTATRELLGEDEACFVDEPSAIALAAAVRELNNNPLRMQSLAKQSRRIAITRFSWPTLAKRLLDNA